MANEPVGPRRLIVEAAELLGQLLLQDVQRGADGDQNDGKVTLKKGVNQDHTLSVHDPEMRHGHKKSHRRFDGHKASVVVDTHSQLMTAVDVLPGYAAYGEVLAGAHGDLQRPHRASAFSGGSVATGPEVAVQSRLPSCARTVVSVAPRINASCIWPPPWPISLWWNTTGGG